MLSGTRAPARTKNRATHETPAFGAFYVLFPRKEKRKRAWRTWLRMGCEAIANDIMAGLHRWLPDFAARPADKVPHPATFLNDEQWQDSPPTREPQRRIDPAVRKEQEREDARIERVKELYFGGGR